jgi:hypothetical protein
VFRHVAASDLMATQSSAHQDLLLIRGCEPLFITGRLLYSHRSQAQERGWRSKKMWRLGQHAKAITKVLQERRNCFHDLYFLTENVTAG